MGQRVNAPNDSLLELFDRISFGQLHGRQDHRHEVLGAVVHLASEQLGPLVHLFEG